MSASPSIFVSSTFVDLKKHREAVRTVIRKLGAVDIAMENIGAVDERPLNECVRLVKKCSDAFVGIYAHRYGHVPKDAQYSITEAEYHAASEARLERLIFLVDEDHPWPPKFVELGEPKKNLERFKASLKSNHVCEFFSNEDDLSARVASAVGRLMSLRELRRVERGEKRNQKTNDLKSVPIARGKHTWSKLRDGVYNDSRGVMLVHTLRPSNKPGQLYDIFLFLTRHRRADFDDIVKAEFFLGKYWQNKVFVVQNVGTLIGIKTSAYGPFLCVCKVYFDDGASALVSRYADFGSSKETLLLAQSGTRRTRVIRARV